jgi:CheY-like chemotaxis protein
MDLAREPLRILIVDDDADTTDSLVLLIQMWGYVVDWARAGPQALGLAHSFRPAVVLLDIVLPGMDGYEVARRLRAAFGAAVVLVAISGYCRAEDRERSRLAGFDHFLSKPPDLPALRALLDNLADRTSCPPRDA